MMTYKWPCQDRLPASPTEKWSILFGKVNTEYESIDAVSNALRNWQPMQPTLVARPGESRYLPPTCIPELAARLQARHRRLSAVGVALMVAFAVLMFPLMLSTPSKMTFGFFVIFVFLAITRYVDAFISLSTLDSLSDRVRFSVWFYSFSTAKHGLIFWTSCMTAIGIAQLFAQYVAGDRDTLLQMYGSTYVGIREGEFWRLVVGPFMHASVAHYVNNFLMLLFIGPITWALFGPWSAMVLVVGNIVGALCQMTFGSAMFDVYVGISSGIFGLFAFLITSPILSPTLLPRGVGILCVGVAAISIVGAELISVSAATSAHVGGLFAGILCAAAVYMFSSKLGPSKMGSDTI